MRVNPDAMRCSGCGRKTQQLVSYGRFDRRAGKHEINWFCANGLTGSVACREAFENEEERAN